MRKKASIGTIQLPPEKRKQMEEDIVRFFQEVREEEIGVIATQEVLAFFLETLGKEIYNQALDDVMDWQQSILENITSDFYSLYKK